MNRLTARAAALRTGSWQWALVRGRPGQAWRCARRRQVPDAAAYAAMGSLAEARRAGSRHVLAELGRLDATLTRRWPAQPQVRQFHEALHAARAA